ncbi:MAG TPA: hypothetical protein VNM22_14810, partial [Candidatus Limnocylindrales bacterium]|nr:hypothetical protein [Candidatus Limnocylindrales bacterium]
MFIKNGYKTLWIRGKKVKPAMEGGHGGCRLPEGPPHLLLVNTYKPRPSPRTPNSQIRNPIS